ncbi:hypothetical protein V6Z11_A13G182500 [Gossypium hirsutum]
MERSSSEMTPSHFDIEKGCVEFEHGLSSFQEKMTSENSDLATMSTVLELEVEEEKMTSENSNLDTMSSVLEVEEEESYILKVPRRLREINEKAYEPNVISVGPYHYRKPHLARMEDFKKWLFEKHVEKPHLSLDQFREAMKDLEGKTRKCYERPLPPDLKDDANFVDMMLYSMINPNPGLRGHFNVLATSALEFFDKDPCSLPINTTSSRHLLDLVHTTFQTKEIQAKVVKKVPCCVPENTSIKHLLRLVRTIFHPSETQAEEEKSSGKMPSATELEDAGIHLLGVPIQEKQKQEQWKECMFRITFDNGTKELKIPTLQVDDFTERLFRNYMAYEQFFPLNLPTYFVDYVVFMDDLINTSKDVELLRKSEIIDNLLGNDEAVSEMFNKLCDSITYDEEGFYYKDIASHLNDHCKRKRNIWKANLKKDYFNSPWSLISLLAALVLLLLAILQTIFSLLSYYHQRQ